MNLTEGGYSNRPVPDIAYTYAIGLEVAFWTRLQNHKPQMPSSESPGEWSNVQACNFWPSCAMQCFQDAAHILIYMTLKYMLLLFSCLLKNMAVKIFRQSIYVSSYSSLVWWHTISSLSSYFKFIVTSFWVNLLKLFWQNLLSFVISFLSTRLKACLANHLTIPIVLKLIFT